jgi:Zinc finger found in FPG and IleRS
LGTLRRSLQEILKKAIALRGSSIVNFKDSDGEPGDYQQHHRAYGREGEKCYRCGSIIRRAIVAGRSSFFCPKCQPGPRGFKVLALPKRKSESRVPRKRSAIKRSKPKRARRRVVK